MNENKSEYGAHGTIGKDYTFVHEPKSAEEIESDNQAAEAEYACGLMTWARRDEDATDWDAIEAENQKMFDSWHKLGPESAQY